MTETGLSGKNFSFQLFTVLQKIKKSFWLFYLSVVALRSLCIAIILMCTWKFINPDQDLASFFIALMAFIAIIYFEYTNFKPLSEKSLLFSLDIKHPHFDTSILYEMRELNQEEDQLYKALLSREKQDLVRHELARVFNNALSALIPFCAAFWLLSNYSPSFATILSEAQQVTYNNRAYLKAIQGDQSQDKIYELKNNQTLELNLLQPNLLEISLLLPAQENPPSVLLKNLDPLEKEKKLQTFQMSLTSRQSNEKQPYQLRFAITENVDIFVPSLSKDKPVARINLKKSPVPIVTLTPKSKIKEPWPDEVPLDLRIRTHTTYPLQQVNLLITIGNKTFKELVNTITHEHLLSLDTTYSLNLERFLEEDTAEIEIVAEVIDRATPQPLVGRSNPLVLKTMSAYGRYLQSLESLRKVKEHVDHAIKEKSKELNPEIKTHMQESLDQSQLTPFFDELDRSNLLYFQQLIDESFKSKNLSSIYDLDELISQFLTEHEMLDDRERDRDFFVATRGFSRLLEQSEDKQKINDFSKKIVAFLEQRLKRWKLRVSYLSHPEKLTMWDNVSQNKIFEAPFLNKDKNGKDLSKNVAELKQLSQTVETYRQWINDLEAAEDKEREEREKNKQEGLASAREELVAIQKRQAVISTKLDKSATRTQEDLDEVWPMSRMNQNTNIKDTNKLAQKIRALSPQAANRLNLALEAMKLTLQNGNDSNYIESESYSDLSNRLLRQAETSSSQQSQGYGRKRRKVAGDNYYGRSLYGGDIELKRDYEVDRRYREDIIEEINDSSSYDTKNKMIFDNYLRRIIR